MTDQNTAAPAAAPAEQVQLSLIDLQNLAGVVDLASRRGAFRAEEMETIGSVFNKLAKFLAFIESSSTKADTAVQPTV